MNNNLIKWVNFLYRQINSCIFLVVAISVCSCTLLNTPYTVNIRNTTSDRIYKARIYFGDYVIPGGVVSPGVTKGAYQEGTPIPKFATIEWESSDGTLYKKVLDVKSLLPIRTKGSYLN